MRRSNGSRNFGQEGSRRVWGSTDHNRMRQTERLQGRNSRDGRERSYETKANEDRNKNGYSGKFEDEDRWNHYYMNNNEGGTNKEGDEEYFGPRGYTEPNIDWKETGVYSTISEEDVKAELDIRGHGSGTGRNGRGSDYMDEDHRWRMAGSERSTTNESGNENEGSWDTGNAKRKRRRIITHD